MLDPSHLSKLWDAHSAKLLLVARAMGDSAEDAVQEAFVELACQVELPEDIFAWLVRVARNRQLQWLRSGTRRRQRESYRYSPSWFDGVSHAVDQQLDALQITEALQALATQEREVIVMHLWGELSFEAIADLTGLSRASANRIFHQGIQELKQRFNHESQLDSIKLCHE